MQTLRFTRVRRLVLAVTAVALLAAAPAHAERALCWSTAPLWWSSTPIAWHRLALRVRDHRPAGRGSRRRHRHAAGHGTALRRRFDGRLYLIDASPDAPAWSDRAARLAGDGLAWTSIPPSIVSASSAMQAKPRVIPIRAHWCSPMAPDGRIRRHRRRLHQQLRRGDHHDLFDLDTQAISCCCRTRPTPER